MTIIETAKMNGLDPKPILPTCWRTSTDQDQPPRRTAALELEAAGASSQGCCLMPTVSHVFMLDYVADILGEHPELIDAIVSNDDNLTTDRSSQSVSAQMTTAPPSLTTPLMNCAI
jgi:hypothetical protein